MNTIIAPHCGARLDRLPDSRWHYSMFSMVAFGLLVCWSNAVGGIILAQLKSLGWADNSITATFSAITTAGMFAGALIGGIVGDKIGRKKGFILFELIHIISMVVGAFSPNMDFLIACRFVMGFGLGALLVTLFAGYTEYMPGRNRGTVPGDSPINFLKINREVSIQTVFRYANRYPVTIEAISSGKFDVKSMVTHIYDYQDVQRAFDESVNMKKDIIKGVIKIGA